MIKFFSADWCTACNALKNVLRDEDLDDVVFITPDHEPDEINKYNIKSIPTLVKLDADGLEVDRKVGAMSREAFLAFKNG